MPRLLPQRASPISCDDISAVEAPLGPSSCREARSAGYASVYAVPMRLRQQVIGSLNLLGARVDNVDEAALVEAQALADVATIGILQHRAASEQRVLAEQLQYALQSRILVEQAKGILSEFAHVDMDERVRRAAAVRARPATQRLVDVAE